MNHPTKSKYIMLTLLKKKENLETTDITNNKKSWKTVKHFLTIMQIVAIKLHLSNKIGQFPKAKMPPIFNAFFCKCCQLLYDPIVKITKHHTAHLSITLIKEHANKLDQNFIFEKSFSKDIHKEIRKLHGKKLLKILK